MLRSSRSSRIPRTTRDSPEPGSTPGFLYFGASDATVYLLMERGEAALGRVEEIALEAERPRHRSKAVDYFRVLLRDVDEMVPVALGPLLPFRLAHPVRCRSHDAPRLHQRFVGRDRPGRPCLQVGGKTAEDR